MNITNKKIKPPPLPEWFLISSDKATFCAKDVALLFGFKSTFSAIYNYKSFPPADIINTTARTKNQWSKSCILKEWHRRNEQH